MPNKRCPKCGKTFEESWELCDECGIELVVPTEGGSVRAAPMFVGKIRERLRSIDRSLDSKMGKAVDTADEAKKGIAGMGKQAAVVATEISEKAEKKAQVLEKKGLAITRRMWMASSPNAVIDMVLDHPRTMLIAVFLVTLVIGISGIPLMLNNISGDMTIYLPQDDEAAKILNEVNEDWSTEMIVLFVETPNKFDRTYGTNITDKAVLDEISAIEEALDPQKDDYGEVDEISFVLSISTLIKEINVAPKHIYEATIEELNLQEGPIGVEGEYVIPENQEDIDRIVSQIPDDTKKLLVIDTNNDEIWDSAGVIIGVVSEDQHKLMDEVYKLIKKYYIDNRAEKGEYNSKDEWWERIDTGEIHCAITPTGPVPMTEALTQRTYQEFSIVLPAAIILICAMLFFLHRTPRIIIVSGIPIFCSLIITLGIMGLTGWVLSPQVILVAPILLALGVAYSLYIANRYSDEKKNIKERKERMRVSIRTTGKAIFLSAVTTAVGFSSLMFVNMVPMRVLGFGLTVGIMICYVVTMLTVPSLVMFLNYEKKGKIRSIEKVGMVPIRHRKKIAIVAIVITIISLSLIPSIQANMNLTEMAPQDEPTIMKMNEYTDQFGGGQLGMVLVRGAPAPVAKDEPTKGGGSMKDIEVLDAIEDMEEELKKIHDPPINPPISVVDVMKMIKVPESTVEQIKTFLPEIIEERVDDFLNTSFWDAIHMANDDERSLWGAWFGKSQQDSIISIFYLSISTEMRGFLVNEDYSKALVYIDMPSMDAVRTEVAVDKVNKVVADYPAGSSTSKLTGFAALMVAVNNLLMWNSLFSLFMALVIVFFVLIIIFRSLRYAALTLIPVSMVVAWEPLTLGLTGIDLNLVTAMIGSIIVGIGIDYGIHMTERIRESGENFPGIKRSVETSGFTFLEATATIVAGLVSIYFINIRSIQEFITMIIILLVFSMVGAMLILPSIYAMLSAERKKTVSFRGEVAEVEPEYGYE
ncbi:MAG: MMPL family transporter [Thermoplasmata archaeon]|nr:MAG: MMPL family transporter [Thermoplasmata archaeon]